VAKPGGTPNTVGTIKLDKSRPYVRATSTLPLQAGEEHLGPARRKLAQALAEAWRAYNGCSDGGRLGVRIALAAACDFIETADPHAGEAFNRFTTVLIAALSDLDQGITAPLLKMTGGRGRATDSFAYRDIQRRAVATMACLMDARYGRDDAIKRDEAVRMLTRALTANGFRTTKRAVGKWYDERLPAEAKQRRGRPPKSAPGPQSEDARLHYVIANHRAASADSSSQYVKDLLAELTWFARLWFPSGSK
jgi:hypothetical protein